MKPPAFKYHRASSPEEVDELLGEHADEAKILAGGQSLVPMLNFRLAHPGHLIDINHISGLATEPEEDGDWISFGPLVRQVTAEDHPLVAEHLPLLHQAMRFVAHPAIRTRGTIVGSIAHADPAAELPSVLCSLGGEVVVRSASGKRTVTAADFFTGPLMNSLEPTEWVEAVRFPKRKADEGFAFTEFARRSGDYALCGVAARASGPQESVELTLTFLGVGVTPETIALGQRERNDLGSDSFRDELRSLVSESLSPYDDIHATSDYKRFLAASLGAKAAHAAAGVGA